MKIYFKVPHGYDEPITNEVQFLPRKNEYVAVYQPKLQEVAMIRVHKVCFDYNLYCVTVVLVEED